MSHEMDSYQNNPRLHKNLSRNYFQRKETKASGEKPAPEFTNSLYCEIKKLITNAAPKRTKK